MVILKKITVCKIVNLHPLFQCVSETLTLKLFPEDDAFHKLLPKQSAWDLHLLDFKIETQILYIAAFYQLVFLIINHVDINV